MAGIYIGYMGGCGAAFFFFQPECITVVVIFFFDGYPAFPASAFCGRPGCEIIAVLKNGHAPAMIPGMQMAIRLI